MKVKSIIPKKVRPAVPWIGGKTRLLKHILPLIPEHKTYVETFGGGAAVLLAKEESKIEVLNDVNDDLINLYRVIQHHLEEFVRQFKWALVSRTMFEWEQMKTPETLTDIQRAARFFYLQRNAFGAKIEKQTFGISKTCPPKFNLLRIEELLSDLHLRLARVLVENLDWQACVMKYDYNQAFHFIDPPYWQTEGYNVEFPWEEYEALHAFLKRAEGKVLITLNKHPDIEKLFEGYILQERNIKYTVGGNNGCAPSKELFITNYRP